MYVLQVCRGSVAGAFSLPEVISSITFRLRCFLMGSRAAASVWIGLRTICYEFLGEGLGLWV